MSEHLILKRDILPSDSYFIVSIEKVNDPILTNYIWPKMQYLFDYSLPITQQYALDGICKKIDNIHHIINIYLPPITKIQYGAKLLAKLAFIKKFNINREKEHEETYENKQKQAILYYNPDLIDLAKILLKIVPNDDCYFIYDTLPINHLYFLHHLFETVYFDFNLIDKKYHVYCKQFLKLDVLTTFKINDIVTYECKYLIFDKITSSFKRKINKLNMQYDSFFTSIRIREKNYLEERLDNQKKFSISISKEVKKRLIEAVNLATFLSLPLSELYLNFDKKNCMIYRLNRFFPFFKNVNNNNFLITEEGLYSVSRPKEADMISKKIRHTLELDAKELVIADMTANVGGNTLSFCKHFNHVYAFELQWLNYLILENNIRVADFQDRCTVIHGDSLQFVDKNKFDVIFFDPPWGGVNYKEQTSVDLYLGEKSMVDIVIELLAKNLSKLIAIKVPYNYNFIGFKEADISYQTHKINNLLLVII